MNVITLSNKPIHISENPLDLFHQEPKVNTFLMHAPWSVSGIRVLDGMEKGIIDRVIIAGNYEERLQEIQTELKIIQAAGGLVFNEAGEILMIFRNGIWDLPKGKFEAGETLASCAVREVEEETGLAHITLKEPLVVTRHIYREKNQWILKESHWYTMQAPKQDLVPQTEEGIQEAEWVSMEALPKRLLNTYVSIKHVLAKANLI